jgi:hypothetical protein
VPDDALPGPLDRLVTLPEELPSLTLGWEAIRWVSKYLRQPNGPRAGERFQMTDSQVRFLLHWYGLDENGEWLYRRAVRRLSKGAGKSPFAAVMALVELCAPVRLKDWDPSAPGGCVGKPVSMPLVQIAAAAEVQPLALDTPVRTVGGWKTVGSLTVGDSVFSSSGDAVPVTRTTAVSLGEPCYRVTFDDGEQVVASAAHGWTVERRNGHGDRWETVTLTTSELASSRATWPRRTMRIPLVAVAGEKRHLMVAPYVLGLWLGDGCKNNGVIAFDWRVRDELEQILREYLLPWEDLRFNHYAGNQGAVNIKRRDGICPRGHDYVNDPDNRYEQAGHPACRKCIKWPRNGNASPRRPSLRERLRDIGVLHDKHIPDDYLQSDYAARMELLRGLIDSDGWLCANGRAGFVNADVRLFDQVCDLLASLGFRYSITSAAGTARRVQFVPREGEQVAKLPHKVARHVASDHPLSRYRRVVSVVPVASVPVRCIGIDTVDHLFMVGRRGVLTHNTENTMRMVRAFAPKKSRVVIDHELDPGLTQYYKAGGGKLHVLTSSTKAAEGAEATFVVGDEPEHWVPGNNGPEFAATLADNLAKSGSRMLETCNAWQPGAGSVAEASWNTWVAQEEGRTIGYSRVLYDARIAPPNTALTDDPEPGEISVTEGLKHAYGDCWWVNLNAIKERIWDSAAEDARRKFLNQPTADQRAWVTPQQWSNLSRPDIRVADGDAVVLFFDGSKSRDATALVGCRMSDGHVFRVGVWEPDPKHSADDVVDALAVDSAVEAAFERFEVVAFFADVKEWDGFVKVTWPARYEDRLLVKASPHGTVPQSIAWDMRSRRREFAEACETCEAEIVDRQFTHDGDPVIARHVNNARRWERDGRTAIGKESPNSAKKVDAAVCVVGARMARRIVLASDKWPPKKRSSGRVIVLA